MRFIAAFVLLVSLAAPARADEWWNEGKNANGHPLYGLPGPGSISTAPLILGSHASLSVLANATSSTGNVTDLGCSPVGGQISFLGSNGTSLACQLVPTTSITGLAYQLVLNQGGSPLTQQTKLNFGAGLLAVNNGGASRTDVTNDFSTGLSGGQTAFGGTGAGEALTLQGTTNSTPGPVKVVVGTSAGQGLRLLRASDGLEAGEFLSYLGGSAGPLGLKLDAILSAPMVSTNELVNNDGQLTITSSLDGPTGSYGITVNSAFGNGDSTGYQLTVVPGTTQLSNPFGVFTAGGALAFGLTPAGAANFLGPMTVSSLVGPGFVKASSAGLFSVDTTIYTPASRTVQGTTPILIAGGTSAVDLSANRVWSLATNGVTYSFLQQGAALSVLGRSANSIGNLADIPTTSGSNAALVENGSGAIGWGKVQNAGFRNSAANSLVGNSTGSSGSVADIGLIPPLFFSGGNLILDYDGASLILSGGTVLERAALTGDVGCPAGSNTCTITANAVTYAKIQQGSAHVLIGNPTGSTANLSEITLGAGLSFSGTTLTASGSGGTVTAVTATAPLVSSGGATPNLTLNIDSTLAVVSSNLGRAAVSGDGTIAAGSNTFSLSNIPTGTTAAGYIDATEIAAPTAGASGHLRIWGDTTNDNFAAITHAGVKVYGAQVATGVSHQWLASFGATGAFTLTQPGFADLSGAESCAQQVALTGDGTTSGCALTISGLALSKVTAPTGTGLAGVTAGAWDAAATTVSTGLHRTTGVLTADLSTGVASGQAAIGGTGSGDGLTLSSTSNATKGKISFGTSASIGLFDEATGKGAFGQTTTDAEFHFVITNDTTPATIVAGDSRHFAIGGSGSTGAGIYFSHTTSTATGNVSFVQPNTAWENARFQALTFGLYSSASTLGLSQDSSGNVYDSVLTTNGLLKTTGGNGKHAIAVGGTDFSAGTAALATGPLCNTTGTGALSACSSTSIYTALSFPTFGQVLVSSGPNTEPSGDSTFTFNFGAHLLAVSALDVSGILEVGSEVLVNGATDEANAELVSFQAGNRDHVNLFVGGGSAPDSPDNSLFLISQNSGTTIPAGRTTGIWATARIEPNGYTGTSSPTITESAGLYIDGAPSVTGATVTVANYAIHIAGGAARFDGPVRLGGVSGLGLGKSLALLDSIGDVSASGPIGAGIVISDGSGGFSSSSGNGIVNLYYSESVGWSGSNNGGLPFNSDLTGNLTFNMPEVPIGYLASQATLTCDLQTNNINAGGSVSFSLTRDGSLVAGSFFTWTSSSSTGSYTASLSTGSVAATDTYSLHYQTGGVGTSPTRFGCQMAFN